jgi:hypothetical protein
MNDVEVILHSRNEEIRELIEELIGEESTTLTPKPTMATLKASLFLLLYNLIESVIYASFELLFDEIRDNCHCFRNLVFEVQSQYKKYDKGNNIDENDLIKLSFKVYSGRITLFSGNIDARSIRMLLHNWGVTSDFHVDNEEKLRDIKEFRNALAHGEKAFKEIGRNYTLSDMQKYSHVIFNYLFEFVKIFKAYIKNKYYMVFD